MSKTLGEIAELIQGELSQDADPTLEITGATGIDRAGAKEITFAVPPHIEAGEACAAAAVIIPKDVISFNKANIKVENPRQAFNILLNMFKPEVKIPKGISPQAHIGENVQLGKDVSIMAFAYVDDNAVIGDGAVLYPHVYIGQHGVVGARTTLHAGVSIREFCKVGADCLIHDNTVIGADGFGFITKEGKHIKVPQVGVVEIGDDVEIGCNVAIDRATTGVTSVAKNTKIDNLVHIGHNCVLGESCLVVAQTGLAGSTIVGHHVTFAGQVGSKGHIKVGSNSVMAARTGLIGDVPENSFYAGFPARPHKEWLKNKAYQAKLPDLIKEVKALKKALAELQK